MIKVKNISKKYGQHLAVDNVNFELSMGEVVGFIGANGAGKSTTMKILSGVLKSDTGSVSIFGHDILKSPLEAKKRIGFLPEDNPLYEEMYVKEYLEYVANMYSSDNYLVDKTITITGLEKLYRSKIHTLSKGNRQRVGLAQALIHDPDFLILDEPTSGLDPRQQLEIRELILRISKSKIIFFSTHILQEISNMCSRVIILDQGHLVHDGVVEKGTRVEELFHSLTK